MTDTNPLNNDKLLRQEYTNEELSEIIRVALKGADGGDKSIVSQEEMLTIGREFGLSEADLVRASEKIATSHDKTDRATIAMQGFKINVVCYVVGVVGVFLVNAVVSPEFWWFLLAAIAYGCLVAVHGIGAKLNPDLVFELLHEETDETTREMHEVSR